MAAPRTYGRKAPTSTKLRKQSFLAVRCVHQRQELADEYKKEEGIGQAKDVAEEWYLELKGKYKRGRRL